MRRFWPDGGLWRHSDFMRLWAGQSVSAFGTLISAFAIPFLAVVTLDASPLQVALLGAAGMAPGFVLGLIAGVWVDRLRRRPILIATDLGRAAVLLTIPLAAAADRLTIGQLVAVALITNALGTCFDLAYRSYLPSLVNRQQLVEANSKLQASASVAEVSGFALGGILVQLLSAAGAVLIDAVTFVVSAFSIWRIHAPEHTTPKREEIEATGTWPEIREGLRYVTADPILRTVAFVSGLFELKRGMIGAVIFLFFARTLDLPAALIGVTTALGGISALLGAILAERFFGRRSFGRILTLAFVVSGLGSLLLPFVVGPVVFVALWLGVLQLSDGADTMHEIGRMSLAQSITPDRLQGRVNSAIRSLEWGAGMLGILLGGLLAEVIGIRPTLLFAALLGLAIPLWLSRSRIRQLERLPVETSAFSLAAGPTADA